MSDLDLGALTRLAEAATPGPWVMTTQGGIESAHYRGPGEDPNSVAQTRIPENWEFIAAANPVTVLALIERVQAAEAVIAEALALHPNTDEWWEYGIPVFDEFDRSSALRRGCQRCGYYFERATGKKCPEYEILSRHENGGTDE